jgi:uncharacterized membrane protein YfcA
MTALASTAGWPLLIAVGCLSGFVSGLFGVGGGMMLVPALIAALPMLGVHGAEIAKIAIATSVATIVPAAIASAQQHGAKGAIDWPIVAVMAPSLMVGSFIAASFASAIDTRLLCLLFVLIALYTASGMVRRGRHHVSPQTVTGPGPGVAMIAVVGLAGGAVSSLIGLGAAFYAVPFLSRFIAMSKAIGTAAALNVPLAAASVLGYASADAPTGCGSGCLGYVYGPAIGPIGITAVLAAPLGARLTHSLPLLVLRRLFAAVLLVAAGNFAIKTLPIADVPAYAGSLIDRLSPSAAAQGPIAAAPPPCVDHPAARTSALVSEYGPRRLFRSLDDCLPPAMLVALRSLLRRHIETGHAFWERPIAAGAVAPAAALPDRSLSADQPRSKRRARLEIPMRNPDRLAVKASAGSVHCEGGRGGSDRSDRCLDARPAKAERESASSFDPFAGGKP